MKTLSNFGSEALSRAFLKNVMGGIEEDGGGGLATCTFNCAGAGITITCQGTSCSGEDSSPSVLGWCSGDGGTTKLYCPLQ